MQYPKPADGPLGSPMFRKARYASGDAAQGNKARANIGGHHT